MKSNHVMNIKSLFALTLLLAGLMLGGSETEIAATTGGYDVMGDTDEGSSSHEEDTQTDDELQGSKSSNSKLKILSVSPGTLSPEFSADVKKYLFHI